LSSLRISVSEASTDGYSCVDAGAGKPSEGLSTQALQWSGYRNRRDYLAQSISDRRGYGTNTHFGFAYILRPALVLDDADFSPKVLDLGDCAGCFRCHAPPAQGSIKLLGRKARKQQFSSARAVRVVSVSDSAEEAKGLGAFAALDVDNFSTVKDCDLNRLLCRISQLLYDRRTGLMDVGLPMHRCSQLVHRQAESVRACIGILFQ
jgi:hypothetical protein